MKLKAEKVQATMLKSQQSGALKKGISSFAVSDYFLNGKIEEVATRQRKISKPDTQSSSSELREILKVIYQ